jgi:hypothetical protein
MHENNRSHVYWKIGLRTNNKNAQRRKRLQLHVRYSSSAVEKVSKFQGTADRKSKINTRGNIRKKKSKAGLTLRSMYNHVYID